MKTNKKINRSPIERELRNLYMEIYNDNELVEDAVRDSLRAYSLVKQDVLYRKSNKSKE